MKGMKDRKHTPTVHSFINTQEWELDGYSKKIKDTETIKERL